MRNAHKILARRAKGGDHSEDVEANGKIILEWIFGKLSGKMWTGFILLRTRKSGGAL
jgi:hypothetical protein